MLLAAMPALHIFQSVISSAPFGLKIIWERQKKSETSPVWTCSNPVCMTACRRSKLDSAVEIPEVIEQIRRIGAAVKPEVDLTTSICGVKCENPFLLSSSVVGSNYEMVAKAFDMGWGGVAFKTIGLFVPEEVSPRFADMRKENTPYVGFKNIEQTSGFKRKEMCGLPSVLDNLSGRGNHTWQNICKKQEAGLNRN